VITGEVTEESAPWVEKINPIDPVNEQSSPLDGGFSSPASADRQHRVMSTITVALSW